MPESKSGALPLGDIPISGPAPDTLGIIARSFYFCNYFFKYTSKKLNNDISFAITRKYDILFLTKKGVPVCCIEKFMWKFPIFAI